MPNYITLSVLFILLILFRQSLSCDEKDCEVGTAVGTTVCTTAAAIGGTALCAVTFGLGCGLAVAAGASCEVTGALISGYGCPQCGSEEAQNNNMPLAQLLANNNQQTDTLVQMNEQLYRELVEIKSNQNRVLSNQDSLLFKQITMFNSMNENHKQFMAAHLATRRHHYETLAKTVAKQGMTNRLLGEGLENLQTNDKLILRNQAEQDKKRALDTMRNQRWFQSLDATGKNLLVGQEEMLYFNFLRFKDQERLLNAIDANDKMLLKDQEALVKQQMEQFLRNEAWFQSLDEQNKLLTKEQAMIMALEFQQLLHLDNLEEGQAKIHAYGVQQLLHLDNLEEGQAKIHANQVKLHLIQESYLRNLTLDNQKLFVGQSMILVQQEQNKKLIERLHTQVENLVPGIKKAQLISLYGDSFFTIDESYHKFKAIYRNSFSHSVSDYVLTEFKDLAGIRGNLQPSIIKIQRMMIGNHPLFAESIYKALGGDFCNVNSHEYFMVSVYNGMLMRSTALGLDGHQMGKMELNRYVKNNIKATEAYVDHCGCPNGFKEHIRKNVSKIMNNLQPSIDDKYKNSIKVALLAGQNFVWRRKALTILQHQNFELSDPIAKEIEHHAIEDIELVIERIKDGYDDQLQFYDNTKTCISKQRNEIVDGNWSQWGSWSECNNIYGQGTSQRTRKCTNPSPKNGGIECSSDESSSTESKICNECKNSGQYSDEQCSSWMDNCKGGQYGQFMIDHCSKTCGFCTLGTNSVCGDCWGAKTAQNPCCNTCEEVREAYRQKNWGFTESNIAQCDPNYNPSISTSTPPNPTTPFPSASTSTESLTTTTPTTTTTTTDPTQKFTGDWRVFYSYGLPKDIKVELLEVVPDFIVKIIKDSNESWTFSLGTTYTIKGNQITFDDNTDLKGTLGSDGSIRWTYRGNDYGETWKRI